MADTALYTDALAIYDFENNANDTKGARNLTAANITYQTTGTPPQGSYWSVFNGSTGRFSYSDAGMSLTLQVITQCRFGYNADQPYIAFYQDMMLPVRVMVGL